MLCAYRVLKISWIHLLPTVTSVVFLWGQVIQFHQLFSIQQCLKWQIILSYLAIWSYEFYSQCSTKISVELGIEHSFFAGRMWTANISEMKTIIDNFFMYHSFYLWIFFFSPTKIPHFSNIYAISVTFCKFPNIYSPNLVTLHLVI